MLQIIKVELYLYIFSKQLHGQKMLYINENDIATLIVTHMKGKH